MKKPIIIGLPGSGKSTVSKLLAQKLNCGYISTDVMFRIYRAIPLNSNKHGIEIMHKFLKRIKKEYPKIYTSILPEAKKGSLSDSKLFRSFGENIFRIYEIEMNKWLFKNKLFEDKIIDLSASAPLYAENRKLFSQKNGYKKFLLDINLKIILPRLQKDYKLYLQNSKKTCKKMPIRGAYEIAAENAVLHGFNSIDGLSNQLENDKNIRIEKYKFFSDSIISINEEIEPEKICEIILLKL